MKLILSILLTLLQFELSAQSLRSSDWKYDIDFLQKELPKKHIDLFSVRSRKEFNDGLENVAKEVDSLNDLEIAIKLQQVIVTFGDSHTSVYWYKYVDRAKMIPLQFLWLSDGIYVFKATKNYEMLLGSKLLSINNIPINIVIDSLKTMITIDNNAIIKRVTPNLINYQELLAFFNFSKNDSLVVDAWKADTNDTLNDISVIIPDTVLSKDDYIKLMSETEPISWKDSDKPFASSYLPDEQIYYIHYNECWSKELEIKYNNGKNAEKYPSFTEFEKKVLNDIDSVNIKKIVFDLRRNSGGDSEQGTVFIEKLFNIPKVLNSIKVYVLIGRYTYSSAIINAMDFKKYNNVVFVGDETSGKPNHFGEVRQLILPHHGLIVYYSTKYFKRTSGNENTIKPDIIRIQSITDMMKGIDQSFEYIKSQ